MYELLVRGAYTNFTKTFCNLKSDNERLRTVLIKTDFWKKIFLQPLLEKSAQSSHSEIFS